MPNFACRLSLRPPANSIIFTAWNFCSRSCVVKSGSGALLLEKNRSKDEIFGWVAIPPHRTLSPNFQLLLVINLLFLRSFKFILRVKCLFDVSKSFFSSLLGTCRCPSGKMGKFCDKPCPQGYWGHNCSLRCQCVNGAQCASESGLCSCVSALGCKCSAGWMGKDCQLRCPEGRWDQNCEKMCHCANQGICEKVKGLLIILTVFSCKSS